MGKRANGEGCLRQRKDGKWEVRITTGRDPGTGKPIRRSFYFNTQKEARKKLNASTHELDEGTYLEPSAMTVRQWLDIWVEEYLVSLKPRTRELYKQQARLHLKPTLGSIKLQALTAPTIQRVYNAKLKDGLSPKSIKNLHGILHKALSQAVKVDYIRFNPADACDLPRVEKPDIRPLEGAQVSQFLKAIETNKYKNLFTFALLTGMREGELMGLTWDAVDFNTGEITIDKQLQRRKIDGMVTYAFAPPKNDKTRRIRPGKNAMDCLRRQRTGQLENKLKCSKEWVNNRNLIFTHEDGQHFGVNTIYHVLKKVAASIDRPDLRVHDLRHTYATLAIENGVSIKTVSQNLGHYSVAFTMDVYGHLTDAMQQTAADIMDAYIENQF